MPKEKTFKNHQTVKRVGWYTCFPPYQCTVYTKNVNHWPWPSHIFALPHKYLELALHINMHNKPLWQQFYTFSNDLDLLYTYMFYITKMTLTCYTHTCSISHKWQWLAIHIHVQYHTNDIDLLYTYMFNITQMTLTCSTHTCSISHKWHWHCLTYNLSYFKNDHDTILHIFTFFQITLSCW